MSWVHRKRMEAKSVSGHASASLFFGAPSETSSAELASPSPRSSAIAAPGWLDDDLLQTRLLARGLGLGGQGACRPSRGACAAECRSPQCACVHPSDRVEGSASPAGRRRRRRTSSRTPWPSQARRRPKAGELVFPQTLFDGSCFSFHHHPPTTAASVVQ